MSKPNTVEQLVRRGAIRSLLVKTGLVHEAAIDDAEGYDGETTLGRIIEFEESLIELLTSNARNEGKNEG
jgi:hypothetical protein